MEYIYYKVAGLLFAIAAPEREAAIVFLPSYASFEVQAGAEEPLFVLTLSPAVSLDGLPRYTEFDWDESRCIVRRDGQNYGFEIHPHEEDFVYSLRCDARFTQAEMAFCPDRPHFSYALNSFQMMLFAFSSAREKALMLHSSVVECGGKAYVFQGKSGTGKSTHSALWLRCVEGAALLNDDNPIARIEDGQVFLYGSPWSGKTPCYRNRRVAAGAFVRLAQAPQNHIRRLGPAEAFASLLPSCSVMKWDKALYDAVCETVGEAVQKVPSYALQCLPDEGAARLCHREVAHG